MGAIIMTFEFRIVKDANMNTSFNTQASIRLHTIYGQDFGVLNLL